MVNTEFEHESSRAKPQQCLPPLLAACAIAAVLLVAPGDLPDNQAFIAYGAAGGFSVKVPEGWAGADVAANHVTFSDKYNSIDLIWKPQAPATTEASAITEVTAAGLPGLSPATASTVQRSGGSAVLVTYQRTSGPNAVTAKRVALDVEQYEFWRSSVLATITLSGTKGADNVDPWKVITNGFKWAP